MDSAGDPTVTRVVGHDAPTVSVSGLTAGNVVEVEQRLDGINWTPLTTRVAAGTSIAGIRRRLLRPGPASRSVPAKRPLSTVC